MVLAETWDSPTECNSQPTRLFTSNPTHVDDCTHANAHSFAVVAVGTTVNVPCVLSLTRQHPLAPLAVLISENRAIGLTVGEMVGTDVGVADGADVGAADGEAVGCRVTSSCPQTVAAHSPSENKASLLGPFSILGVI